LNILFVSEYYLANHDFVKLSVELAKRKHSVSVVTSFRNFDKREFGEGVQVFEIKPFTTIYSVPHSLSFPLLKISRLVEALGIQVVHGLMDYSTNTAVAFLVSKAAKIPFVYTVQGMGTRTERVVVDTLAELYDWTIERSISQNAKKLILLSKSLVPRTRKLGIPDENVVVIPSGVDCVQFDPERQEVREKATVLRSNLHISHNDFIVGYIGRLVPAKGLPYLLEAVAKIKRTNPNLVLLLVGEGTEKVNLQAMADDLGIRAHFVGYQTDTLPYYALMDVFVLPSFFEGLSGVVLEAMAMEKPIVATNVGGTSDMVCNSKNGFLVHPRDFEGIASALEKLISQDDLRLNMGKVGREIAKKDFQWDNIVDRVETVYKEVVNE